MSGRALHKQNRYYQWWVKIEKKIFRLAIILFFTLYALQLVNFVLEQRNSGLLSNAVGELEGIPVAESQTQINTGTIELSVISNSKYSKIQIYLNGEYYKSFNKKSISLMVKNNDIIEISGINSEFPATIKITSTTDNIISPKLDSVIKVNRSFVQAGRVRLK
ncbi:MAG: hypothetical protein K0R80_1185 [Clostridia bacterium]|jgi:hypothetical protein|nr:hypothetical protein [Clostridia bacterium]